MVPVALLVLLVAFSLIHLTPGNPAYTILGEQASRGAVAALDRRLGLDRPLLTQFLAYVGDVGRGDLGRSLTGGQSVSAMIVSRLPVTGELSGLAILLSLVIAVPAGVLSARRPHGWADSMARLLALAGATVPNFLLALLAVYLFAVSLGWFPSLGWAPLGAGVVPNLYHLALPATVLSLPLAAVTSRILRGELLEATAQPYVRTALAKGLSPHQVLVRHVMRNAALPVVTVLGLQVGALMGGVVITESIFSLPGMGQLLVTAIFDRDYPVLDGAVLAMAGFVITTNLIVDLLYTVLDPRIRVGAKAEHL